MTKGYITAFDLVQFAKPFVGKKEGFTKWVSYDQIGDVVPDFDGRYVVSVEEIAKIKDIENQRIILWNRPNNKEIKDTYFGGWYNQKDNLYEIEEVMVYNNFDHALKEAIANKQLYIYDLIEHRVISVEQQIRYNNLTTTLVEVDNILDKLQLAWNLSTDSQIKDNLNDEWENLVKVKKRIERRLTLLKAWGEILV